MKNKFLLIAAFSISIPAISHAQEIGLGAHAGFSGLKYAVPNGNEQTLFGGELNLDYTYYLNKHWGLSIGLGLAKYNSKASLNSGNANPVNMVDDRGDAFVYQISTQGYAEKQSFNAFTVPLMAKYRTAISKKADWFINGGGKIIFPAKLSYKTNMDGATVTGYYPDLNVTINNLPQHGFGSINNWSANNSQSILKTGFALAFETGLDFHIAPKRSLYIGLYTDYGLTDMRKSANGSTPLFAYSPNGISTTQNNSILVTSNAGPAKILAYGLMVRIGFGGFSKHTAEHKTNAAPAAEQPIAVAAPVGTTKKESIPTSTASEQDKQTTVTQAQQKDTVAKQTSVAVQPISEKEEQLIKQPIIFRVLGKKDVPDSLKPHLAEVAALLNKFDQLQLNIIGHTCNIGTHEQNMKVGFERAEAVADYFQDKGISRSRIKTMSKAEQDPVAPNNSKANRERNRYVEVIIVD